MSSPPDQLSTDLASLRIHHDEDPDRIRPLRWIAGGSALLGAAAALYFLGAPYVGAKVFKTAVAVTEIASLSAADPATEVTATGYVQPLVVSHVGAKVAGRVARVHVREGDEVKAGEILVELDDSDQRTAIAAAQSRVQAARARAQLTRANNAEVRLQLERQRRLAERGAAALSIVEDLQLRVQALEEAAKAADAEARVAAADKEQAEVYLRNLVVRAPLSGKVVTRPPQVGDLVGSLSSVAGAGGGASGVAGGIAGVGGTVVDIADFRSLVVEADVPEGRLHAIKPGGPGEVVLDAFPGKRLRAVVAEITPRVNRAKATVTVRLRFLDGTAGILPEMAARVSFLSKPIDAAALAQPPKVVVPTAAVSERGGAKVVFVVEGERVRMVPVTVGEPVGTGFELIQGPPPGTRVVRDPPATMSDGNPIKEKNQG